MTRASRRGPLSPDLEAIEVGFALPTVVERVDPVQMFYFSAATNDGHRIHYDAPWTTEVEGFEGLVVHGGIQAALMTKMITDWAGPAARLSRVWWRNHAIAYPSMDLTFSAVVVGKGHEAGAWSIEIECVETHDDTRLMTGGGTVTFLSLAR